MIAASDEPNVPAVEITVLYDNYALCEECRTDWGFACMVTGTEKTILFDAGTYGSILLENMDKLQVNAGDVDVAIISHDHLDHTGGLTAFLNRKSGIPVYLPKSVSSGLVQSVEARGATVVIPEGPQQIGERVHLTGPLGTAIIEQALVLDTPKGLAVITGCAHPGVVQIIRKAKDMLGKEVYLVMGGFHLLNMSDSQVRDIIEQFRVLGVRKAGPSHCTGPRAIELFRQAYHKDFVPIGVGRIQMPVECDFTGDWMVDIADLIMLIEHWGQSDPRFDIAPPLFGDGTVNAVDLETMMSYWGEEIPDPSLIAHWRLDETEGMIAHDSLGSYDATVMGEPVWRPAAGAVDGALELGETTCVVADFVLNPSDGPFSVFAWVKDGEPGQVIVSQQGGANWLMADQGDGSLATELRAGGRSPKNLGSQMVITDGNWHRVGFTWDGGTRRLYVDDVLVAEDAQIALERSTGKLLMGCGKDMAPDSFWSGLIDDVRIYDRTVKP
jgi:7,8-dihydropterin-6-yl-methyl-4-(beta-D-ribofuranosyl)aminobenzene 5'-phosphate synthase